MSVLEVLAPDFALIALGFALRRWALAEEDFWAGLEKLVYFVLFPALLFKALAQADIEVGSAAGLIGAVVAAGLAAMALAWAGKKALGPPPVAFASTFQCAFRFNSYIGFAVLGRLHGDAGIAAMALMNSVMIPLVNVAAVWALARHAGTGAAREIVRNPLIIATVAGAAWNASGLPLPGTVAHTAELLARAALPLGLIAVGAGIRFAGGEGHRGLAAWITGVKLAAMPLAAMLAAAALGLTGVYRDAAVVFAALPASPSSFILAARMGGDGALVARILTAQILVAGLTLPLWLAALSA